MAASTLWAKDALETLALALEAAANADKAVAMEAYLRDQFPMFGVQSKDMKKVLSDVVAQHGKPTGPQVVEFAQRCWKRPQREFHYAGTKLLRRFVKQLDSGDVGAVRELVASNSWWDTVDELAVHVVGGLVAANPELARTMDTWSVDPDIWVARTAILHQLMYKERTNTDQLFGYCEAQADHGDFFIRKAIGWALRQYAKTDPQAVLSFVDAHAEQLSALSKREALKHL